MTANVRTIKYEEVYLHRYETVPQLANGLKRYFASYNEEGLHQSLDYRTPAAVSWEGRRSACGGGILFRPARPQPE
ncbi:MAG: integrase core domain-containing protein [Terriglobales bacterium]